MLKWAAANGAVCDARVNRGALAGGILLLLAFCILLSVHFKCVFFSFRKVKVSFIFIFSFSKEIQGK